MAYGEVNCESPKVRDAVYIGFLHNSTYHKSETRECTSDVSGRKRLEWKTLLDGNRRMMYEDNTGREY